MNTSLHVTNNAVAGKIVAMLANTLPSEVSRKVEEILDAHYKNRRASKSSNDGRGAVRFGDSGTSVEAARKVNVTASIVKLLRVMESFRSPRVVEEIVAHAGIPGNSGSTRFSDMRKDGLVEIYDTVIHKGRRKTRYVITAAGDRWIETHGDRFDKEGKAYDA